MTPILTIIMGLISSWIILLFVALVLLFVSVTAQNTEQLGDSFDVNPLDTNAAIEASVKRQIGYSFGKYIFSNVAVGVIWCRREHAESNALSTWKLTIFIQIDKIISF